MEKLYIVARIGEPYLMEKPITMSMGIVRNNPEVAKQILAKFVDEFIKEVLDKDEPKEGEE